MFLFSARLCYNIDVETGYSTSQEEGVTMKQTIITISREFGSGGHFIGEEVSKRLRTQENRNRHVHWLLPSFPLKVIILFQP